MRLLSYPPSFFKSVAYENLKRRGWDLNPRWSYPHSGFRDRPVQPLQHLSSSAKDLFYTERSELEPTETSCIRSRAAAAGDWAFAANASRTSWTMVRRFLNSTTSQSFLRIIGK